MVEVTRYRYWPDGEWEADSEGEWVLSKDHLAHAEALAREIAILKADVHRLGAGLPAWVVDLREQRDTLTAALAEARKERNRLATFIVRINADHIDHACQQCVPGQDVGDAGRGFVCSRHASLAYLAEEPKP